ncbi:GNAT family N-acetyltransferase [Paenibacillus sp. NFR01]|uniref:GNAT family N-acetyltransferase n=1 Tax=Paenibacillus sp. NFR01 TaxID=1566279 RepID=UPI000B83FE94|nr:GNAT family N-acetyltransferase [Paenibacillus sp. NFR01]
METEFRTYDKWDHPLWASLEPIYREAFPSGAKPEHILRGMVERGVGRLHAAFQDGQAVALAVTGFSAGDNGDPAVDSSNLAEDSSNLAGDCSPPASDMLIIDYLAVRKDLRGSGLGTRFLEWLGEWAKQTHGISGILIEAESGDTPEHLERIRFWERNGFVLTPYVHQYVWVPEPYQAMLLPLGGGMPELADGGEALFRHITSFHGRSFRKG